MSDDAGPDDPFLAGRDEGLLGAAGRVLYGTRWEEMTVDKPSAAERAGRLIGVVGVAVGMMLVLALLAAGAFAAWRAVLS
jgi:hypothetical protein